MKQKINDIFNMNKKNNKQKEKVNETEVFNDNAIDGPEEIKTSETEKEGKKADKKPLDPLTEALTKVEELNDKYLRLFSEFDNFRKRTLKEKIEMSKTAAEETIISMLDVVDDFDRAQKSISESNDIEAVKEGINLIYTKFKAKLAQKGVEEMISIGEEFNTDLHEAITNITASDESQKGKVVDEVQKGYTMHGKVIRFSKVIVAN
jgi:molecular chaperone GrpE